MSLSPIRPHGFLQSFIANWILQANGGYQLVGMSRSGGTLFYKNATVGSLYQSIDEGVTKTLVKAYGGTATIENVTESEDNECFIVMKENTSRGKFYKTTGWAVDKTTATIELALTTIGGFISAFSSLKFSQTPMGDVVICEYDAQTDTSRSPTGNVTAARRVYHSANFGIKDSFRIIFDIYLQGLGANAFPSGVHTHGAAIARDGEFVVVTTGDNTGLGQALANQGGANKMQALISYNYREAKPTWEWLTVTGDMASAPPQVTGVAITTKNILFTSDQTQEGIIYVIPRLGYKKLGTMHAVVGVGLNNLIGGRFNQRHDDGNGPYPIFVSSNMFSGTGNPYSYISEDEGSSFNEFFNERDTATRPLVAGVSMGNILGPTKGGKIYTNYAYPTGGGPYIMQADLVTYEPGQTYKATLPFGSAVALTDGVAVNVASISLPEGIYELDGLDNFTMTGATVTKLQSAFSTVSATLPGSAAVGGLDANSQGSFLTNLTGVTDTHSQVLPDSIARTVYSAAGDNTVIYLVALASFSAGTMSVHGSITARRL